MIRRVNGPADFSGIASVTPGENNVCRKEKYRSTYYRGLQKRGYIRGLSVFIEIVSAPWSRYSVSMAQPILPEH